jgi:hypothetical protein
MQISVEICIGIIYMRMLKYILNAKDSWPLPYSSKFSNKLTFARKGNLKIYNWPYKFCIVYSAIGTVQFRTIKRESDTRFSTSGFFHESVSPGPMSTPLGRLEVFQKFAKIFLNEYLSPVSTTPAISCSPVSTTPAINFIAGVVNTGD